MTDKIIRELLEPKSRELNKFASNDAAQSYATTSIAISLKRIADALDDIVRAGAPINVDRRPI